MKVVVRSRQIVAIVARGVPSGERTMEALLTEMLARSDPDEIASLLVISARKANRGAADVHKAFPSIVRALVLSCYEKAKHAIASKSSASIVLASRRAHRGEIAAGGQMVRFALTAKATTRRSRAYVSGTESGTDADPDKEPPLCCARYRVCNVPNGGPLRAEWVCYECSTRGAYSLLCSSCADVHRVCDWTHEHETLHISEWPVALLDRPFR
jgi:hypothetical protein